MRAGMAGRDLPTAGFVGSILQEADSETTVIQFVADGFGASLLPE